jgi:iron complex transport system substrate-binding protein
MMHSVRLSFLVMLLLLVGTTAAQDDDTTNLAACVDTYDENVDYFPVKSVFDYAEGVSVTYFNNYKVVTVTNAFYDAPAFDYVLVQCGTPAPSADDFPEGTLFIDVPINDAVVLSTTQLPHFVDLGLLDNLVAVDSGFYIYNQEIQDLVASGDIAEVGSGPSVNVELVLDLDPDMVFTYGYNPDSDAHPILIESGVFTALNGEYREAHPLGRAEWLKFTGLFFNAEAEVNILFEDIAIAYEDLRELTSLIPADERVEVLTSTFSSFSDAWSVPGSETYAGFFLQDAGANVVLGDQVSGSSES